MMRNRHYLPTFIAAMAAACMTTHAYCQDNYIRTVESLDETSAHTVTSTSYFDIWGRLSQTVAEGSSSGNTKLASMVGYDSAGRKSEEWCAVPTSSVQHIGNFPSVSSSYYGDSFAYSRTNYDGLGRPLQVTTPGQAFTSHPTEYEYLSNVASDLVRKYTASMSSTALQTSGYYSAGSLRKTRVIDPEGCELFVFSNSLGQKILERRKISNSNYADTYYVYDERQQLRFVLSPKYQTDPNPDVAKLAFHYEYDGLGRCESKTLPGCDPVSYQYDSADRVISMQDGVLSGQSKHRVLEYDGLGRVTRQRISGGSTASYDEIVNYYDSYDFLDAQTEYSTAVRALLAPSSEQHSDCQLTGSKQRASNGELILTVFEYDDFGRIIRQAEVGLNKRISVTTFEYNFWGGVTKESTKTYKTRADGTCHAASEFETIRKYEGQHTKLLTSALLIIRKDETGTMCNDSIIIQHPTYDDFGRMTYDDRSGTAADMQYSYDNMHGWLTQVRSGGGFEQNIYRESGSSQHYYNGNIAAMTWKMPGSNSIHQYSYTYDGMNRLTQAQYRLTAGGATVHSDLLNLIPQSSSISQDNYGEQITYDRNSNITSLKRYGMLNTRNYGLIDDLSIEYDGNQRKKADDAITASLTYSGASDFVDGSNTDVEYTYDANGSLTKDQNRGISSIEYDLLGNIRKIIFSNGNTTQYIYSADGRRLRTIHYSLTIDDRPIFRSIGTPGIAPFGRRDSIENIGNLILKNGHPSQYLFDGGYASFNADTFDDWHYYIQDYMGNVRMVVNSDGTVEQQNHYYPYGGIIGNLSTNQDLQTFKFESKELDRKFGLDWYDIHARQYDAIGVPSWNKVDALAEKNPHLSPYVFAGGNPVNIGDYDGLRPSFIEGAQMCSDTYQYHYLDGGWSLSKLTNDLKSNNSTGFSASIYERTISSGTEYALVFRGTDGFEDVIDDITQVFGYSYQCDAARTLASDLIDIIGNSELTILGHSAGGVQAMSAADEIKGVAITYNTAWPSIFNNVSHAKEITNYVNSDWVTGLQIATSFIPLLYPAGDFIYNHEASVGHGIANHLNESKPVDIPNFFIQFYNGVNTILDYSNYLY